MNELTEVEQKVSTPSANGTGPDRQREGPRGITASTATQELDDLMGQLVGFKMPQDQQKVWVSPLKTHPLTCSFTHSYTHVGTTTSSTKRAETFKRYEDKESGSV